jgi:hypothetical protein
METRRGSIGKTRQIASVSTRKEISMKSVLAVCLAVGLAVCLAVGLVGWAIASPASAAGTTLLRASPKQVNFGTKAVGTFTIKGSTITNTGSSDVLVLASGGLPDDFQFGLLEGQTCPVLAPEVLAAGESCDIVAAFRPTEFFAGREQLAVLQVTATDPATGATVDSLVVEFRGVGKSAL